MNTKYYRIYGYKINYLDKMDQASLEEIFNTASGTNFIETVKCFRKTHELCPESISDGSLLDLYVKSRIGTDFIPQHSDEQLFISNLIANEDWDPIRVYELLMDLYTLHKPDPIYGSVEMYEYILTSSKWNSEEILDIIISITNKNLQVFLGQFYPQLSERGILDKYLEIRLSSKNPKMYKILMESVNSMYISQPKRTNIITTLGIDISNKILKNIIETNNSLLFVNSICN